MILTEVVKVKEGRNTVYNKITTEEKLKEVNPENLQLTEDFMEYLESVDRSRGTIKQYRANLNVFWCWNLEFNSNKFFVDLTKRELVKFQNHALNEWKWSPRRIRVVKATISSLSNFMESILDDEFEDYRSIIKKIESPPLEAVREKSVFTQEKLQVLLDILVKEEEYMKACLLALAMYSGRRKSELTRFKASYFKDEYLICEGALYKTPEKMKTKGRGQRGKMLDVYTLVKPFKPYLDLWMQERERLDITSDWLSPKYKNGEWIDESIDTGTIDSYSKTYTRILGKPFYPHSCRHMFCTMLLEQNLPETVVQGIIGWQSSDMVRIYDDRSKDTMIEKYFGDGGIKKVEQKGIEDL